MIFLKVAHCSAPFHSAGSLLDLLQRDALSFPLLRQALLLYTFFCTTTTLLDIVVPIRLLDVETYATRIRCFAAEKILLIINSYVCQHVEVRGTSPAQAAKWLAIQGPFALVRVAIWIWDPDFDDFSTERHEMEWIRFQPIRLSEEQLVILWHSHIPPKRIPPVRF